MMNVSWLKAQSWLLAKRTLLASIFYFIVFATISCFTARCGLWYRAIQNVIPSNVIWYKCKTVMRPLISQLNPLSNNYCHLTKQLPDKVANSPLVIITTNNNIYHGTWRTKSHWKRQTKSVLTAVAISSYSFEKTNSKSQWIFYWGTIHA